MIVVERITEVTQELRDFANEEGPKIAKLFNNTFNFNNCVYDRLPNLDHCVFLVARRNDEIVGVMIGFLFYSPLDIKIRILQQQLFYVKPDSGRSAFHLFKKFIDIGKCEANHIITMLTSQTNIKASTLENWGFNELETLYRMEV